MTNTLIEKLKKLESSPVSHKARRWVPLVDVIELICQHQAEQPVYQPLPPVNATSAEKSDFTCAFQRLPRELAEALNNGAPMTADDLVKLAALWNANVRPPVRQPNHDVHEANFGNMPETGTDSGVSRGYPVVGDLRDYDKGCEIWTGTEWHHYSNKNSKTVSKEVFDHLNATSSEQREISLPPEHFICGKILDALGSYLDNEQFDRNGQPPTVTNVMDAIRPYLRTTEPGGLLDPDMPVQQLRLHLGELNRSEILVARAAIRWANTRQPEPVSVDLEKGGMAIAAVLNRPDNWGVTPYADLGKACAEAWGLKCK